jgi:hypothetical protein
VFLNEPKNDWSRAKEVKVKIPMGHHVKLHSVKVLTGKPISEAVKEALDLYFAAHSLESALVVAGFADESDIRPTTHE